MGDWRLAIGNWRVSWDDGSLARPDDANFFPWDFNGSIKVLGRFLRDPSRRWRERFARG